MKRITRLTILLIAFVNSLAFSQTDTVFTTHSIEHGALEPQHFLTEYERAFRVMTPAKWMFKCDLLTTFPGIVNSGIGFSGGVETKLTNTVSINLDALYDADKKSIFSPNKALSLHGNVRWYANMASRIRAQKSAPNFSGNYWGIGATTNKFYSTANVTKYLSYSVSYGVQRRLLRYGYFDISFNGGIKQILGSRYHQHWIFFAEPKAALGLALYTPNKKGNTELTVCELFKCYSEKQGMWKIDLFQLLKEAEYSPNTGKALRVNPYIAYEHKLWKSSFSFEASVQEKFQYFDNPQQINQQSSWQGNVEMRWYYHQKRKILNGKSGNNLSGAFFAINAKHLDSRSHFSDMYYDYSTRSSSRENSIFALWGLQYSIGNYGFMQFKLGVGPGTTLEHTTDRDGVAHQYKSFGIDSDAEVKIGIAF